MNENEGFQTNYKKKFNEYSILHFFFQFFDRFALQFEDILALSESDSNNFLAVFPF
jgi:hypothetical protein